MTESNPEIQSQDIAATKKDALVGKILDHRYHIESVLGEGGIGLVYRAKHIKLNKPLAIKVLKPEVSKDAEIIGRFQQEAQSASAIGNPHIVDITDFGNLPDGSTYFVMEFLSGFTLSEVITKETRLDFRRIIHIAMQLCNALNAAHSKGIVHRDLKPDNIMLISRDDTDDFVKILDFGIAKVGESTGKFTQVGKIFGTPHYMSPEQCSGTSVDHRADIYALGIILYELCTDHVPFESDTLMGLLSHQVNKQPPPIRPQRHDTPEWLEALIMKCLEKNPAARFSTMKDVAKEFRNNTTLTSHFPQSSLTSLYDEISAVNDFNTYNPIESPVVARASDVPNHTTLGIQTKSTSKLVYAMFGLGATLVIGAAVWLFTFDHSNAPSVPQPQNNLIAPPSVPTIPVTPPQLIGGAKLPDVEPSLTPAESPTKTPLQNNYPAKTSSPQRSVTGGSKLSPRIRSKQAKRPPAKIINPWD